MIYLIAAIVILIGQIALLCGNSELMPVVKAGKANKFAWRTHWSRRPPVGSLECQGNSMSTADFKALYVTGGSMGPWGVNSGDTIYVTPLAEGEKEKLREFPILVFKLLNMPGWQSQYKLRKFLKYVNEVDKCDWKAVYKQYEERLKAKIGMDDFVAALGKKVQEQREQLSGECILSETYTVEKHKYEFSLHPVRELYGEVKYVDQTRES